MNAIVPWLYSYGIGALGGGLITLIAVALATRRRKKIEDPARLAKFIRSMQSLPWEKDKTDASLNELAEAMTSLVQREIHYYYKSRSTRRVTSQLFRFAAFNLGTFGLLCPLIEVSIPAAKGLANVGYVLLALAAASFAGNELFGGTRGHIRSVITQYKLESLLTTFVLQQSKWRFARAHGGEDQSAAVFEALDGLCKSVYAAIETETKEWGAAITEAESSFGAGLKRTR